MGVACMQALYIAVLVDRTMEQRHASEISEVPLVLTCHWIRTEDVVCGVAETDPGGSPGTAGQQTERRS